MQRFDENKELTEAVLEIVLSILHIELFIIQPYDDNLLIMHQTGDINA